MANYWDNRDNRSRRTPATQKQITRPSDSQAVGPNGLTKAETDALIFNLTHSPQAANNIGDQFASGLSKSVAGGAAGGLPLVYDVATPTTSDTWNSNVQRDHFYNGPSLGASMGSAKGMLGDMVDGVMGIGRLVADEANQAQGEAGQSPEALMEMLRQQYGTYQYGGPSAETMVSREFDPQFAALSQMEQGTTNRYKKNSADMAGLYKAYADDVLSGRDANAQTYADATKSINDTYSGAQTNVTNNMNAASKEMGAQLALLGQQEAAPAVYKEKSAQLSNQLGDLSKAQGAAAALNTQLGANTYAADTASHGIAQQAGLNAGQELMGQYEQLMNQYGAQRLGLEGSRGQALNNYGMNIESLIQKGNQGIQEQIAKSFGDLLSQQDKGADREIQQGRLDLDLARFAADQNKPAAAQDPSKMNPYDALLARSGQYNTDPTEAANDAEVVYQTALNDPGAQNMAVLMNLIEENNPGWLAQPGNKAIAYDYFNRILGQKQ